MREGEIDSGIREVLGITENRLNHYLTQLIHMVLRNRPDHVSITETNREDLERQAMAKVSGLYLAFGKEVKQVIYDLNTEPPPFMPKSAGPVQ